MESHDPFDLQQQHAAKSAQEEANERSKRRALLELEDLKWLMQNKRGRRFVYRVMERAGVVGTLESFFNMNALKMAYMEGLSVEGKLLHNTLNVHCPEFYQAMIKENANAE